MFQFTADSIANVKTALRKGIVTVTFIKKDGTERVMVCTTALDRIPTACHPSGNSSRPQNPEAQKVFDTEKGAWRSFRWDSVTNVQF